MDPEIPMSPISPAAPEQTLREEVQSLRMLAAWMLLAIGCLAAAMSIFLFRQVRTINRQVVDQKRIVNEHQTNALPKINWFIGNLQSFAKTNPDFNPILAKYGLLPSQAPANSSPGAAPVPAPGPKK